MTGFVVFSVIIIMIVTCTIATLSYRSISSLSETNLLSIQKNQELKKLDNLISRVRDLHSDVSDYVITRDSGYIRNTSADKKQILSSAQEFAGSLPDSAAKQNMLLLNNLIERTISYNENIIKLYQLGGRDIALEYIETGKASVLGDSIELLTTTIKDFETHELETSVTKYNNAAQRTRLTILVAAGLIIFLGLVFMLTTVRNLQRRANIIAELEKAKEASEKAAMLKSQFVSNMSHEIRTPLNSIIGFTNILGATKMDTEQADFVHTIKHASENLLSIVNDVLDFSKIEAGMMRMEAHEFKIDDVLDNLRKLFEHRVKEKGLKLDFTCDDSVPVICIGDSIRLNQILVNLVGNSIKFTEKGSVSIKIKSLEVAHNRTVLEVKVKDTGVGIPRDMLPKIFERFEQIDNNASRKHYGTGLGLSIVKSLVELEGGTIRVSSIPGDGTEFVFTVVYKLPIGKAQPAAVAENNKVKLPQPEIQLSGKVLLVEDNPVNQKLAGFILKKWNIDYDIATTGLEACEMLKNKTYALVLMDIQMPKMDGYQATKIIRDDMKLRVPIVALTAHAMEDQVDGFTRAGMNGYLTKPFKEEQLYNVLLNFLQNEPLAKNVISSAKSFTQVIDFTEVEKISGGNKLFVKELADIFVSQIQTELSELEEALLNADFKKLKSTAHSMKSTVAYMGLIEKLEEPLSFIEKTEESELTKNELIQKIDFVKNVCLNAIKQLEAELPGYMVSTYN